MGPTCQTPHAIAAWLPRAAPLQRVKSTVGTAHRRPNSAVPTAPPRCPNRLTPPPLSEATPSSVSEAHRCPAASAVVITPTVSEAESPRPSCRFRPWSVELTSPSLLPVVGSPPATVAPPCWKNDAAEPVFSPSPSMRSFGELSPPPPSSAGSLIVVGARTPPFAPPPPLWHRRRPRRDARPGAVTAPACAAPRRRGPHRTRPARQAPLCNWAEREFGPVALKLIFLFSEYIQILTNLKICVGFI
jgi:hypothetical protein